jgi:GntR family transcriptional regulator/MocR family aminotransferase
LGDVLTFAPPAGGLAVWSQVRESVDLEAWQARAAADGVPFQTGRHFTVDGSFLSCARFGFAAADEKTLAGWVSRLRKHLVERKPGTARRKRPA